MRQGGSGNAELDNAEVSMPHTLLAVQQALAWKPMKGGGGGQAGGIGGAGVHIAPFSEPQTPIT